MSLNYKLRALMKLNMQLFVDMHMLREGAFINVASGALFYDGSDMSILLPDTGADDFFFGLSDGQVWQSPFRQWVYESGVPIDGTNVQLPPIAASGLYIEGAFRRTNDSEFGHTIDFLNGRIIFDSPQSLGLKVQGEFAAREVRVGFEHQFNQQFQQGFLESKYTTNPLTSFNLVYPSGNAQPFPAVFIEVDERKMRAYELGNRSAIITDSVKFHIWALDDLQRDNIVDILTGQWHKSVPIIDFNMAPLPLSGIHNTLSPEYHPYQTLLRNNKTVTSTGSGTPIRYTAYLGDPEDASGGFSAMNLPAQEEFERALVIFDVAIYLNAPITPLGHLFGPISTIPTIQDTGL